ncbi:MAG: carboxypeptidase-like regulatory domain-containing protein, partial [Acidobacteria bacterium]|nr:carboxypeptidase-like regulatory domain-containing protein [Acidobacteriota bacterium]
MAHRIGFVLAIVLVLATGAAAQEIRATLFGRVIDPTGASVPGAKIVITNRATNVTTEVTTNIEGNYVAAFLPPGEYSVTVEREGFSRIVRDNIVLQTLERLGVDFTLKTGNVSESVTVSAESPMIQTASADFGQVVNSSFVNRLPGVGANPLGFADMAPGVMPNNPDGNLTTYTTAWVQFNGSTSQGNQQPGTGNQLTIDGAPADVPRMSGVSYVIPMKEMLSEMKVVTAMFDAAQGRTNGGALLLTTKSGTNMFHGSAYYHFRDERFNANSWSNNYVRRARGQQNYWLAGGTVNGPIIRDRTFFSFGMEKERNIGVSNYSFRVPTALERQGDFSQTLNNLSQPLVLYDPLTTVMDAKGNFVSRQPYPGARLPSGRIDPVGSALVNQYPQPNYTIFPNLLTQVNYLVSVNSANPNLNLQTRLDHALNSKHRVYFRLSRNHGTVSKYDRPAVAGYAGVSGSQQGNTD